MAVTKGKYTYGEVHQYGNGNNVIIGNFTSIAEANVFDGGQSHDPYLVTTYPFKNLWPSASHIDAGYNQMRGDIIIGSDVTIGMRSYIATGVNIGHGAVIGAMSFISKDVEPYSIVVGANVVKRKRFNTEQINSLLEIAWWDWDDERITRNVHLLLSPDIDKFINEHI
jgi:acetyltransferase-like isoleucine patch superfamily enzyme